MASAGVWAPAAGERQQPVPLTLSWRPQETRCRCQPLLAPLLEPLAAWRAA